VRAVERSGDFVHYLPMSLKSLVRELLRWPFTLFGIFSLAMGLLVALGIIHHVGPRLPVYLIPLYVMQLGILGLEGMVLGAGPPPPRVVHLLTLPILLAPYLLLDLLLRWLLRAMKKGRPRA